MIEVISGRKISDISVKWHENVAQLLWNTTVKFISFCNAAVVVCITVISRFTFPLQREVVYYVTISKFHQWARFYDT